MDDHLDDLFAIVFWYDELVLLSRLLGHRCRLLLLETLSKEPLIVATSLVVDLAVVVPRLRALAHDLRRLLAVANTLVEVLSRQLALASNFLHLIQVLLVIEGPLC